MFRQNINQGSQNPSMIPNQSTYPPYMDFPGYQGNNLNNETNSFNSSPQPEYAETIFTLNRGKRVSVHLSYPDSIEWRDRVFTGTILSDGRDYLMLKQDDGQIVLLWLVYINFTYFDETASY